MSSRTCSRNKGGLCITARSIPFEAVGKGGSKGYEIRLYTPRFVVEMPYKSRDVAYLAFDQYLTGKNEAGVSLEALSPVVMRHQPDKGTKVMQMFVMPLGTSLTLEVLLTQQPPLPNDPKLSLNIAGGEAVSVFQFPGQATQKATYQALAAQKALLKRDGVELADEATFSVAQYNPVHALRERTNEVWLAVRL